MQKSMNRITQYKEGQFMDNERTASISIGGDEYMLLLTTKATK